MAANTKLEDASIALGDDLPDSDDDLPDLVGSESEDDTDSDVESEDVTERPLPANSRIQEWFDNQTAVFSGIGRLMTTHAYNICDPASAGPCYRDLPDLVEERTIHAVGDPGAHFSAANDGLCWLASVHVVKGERKLRSML